MGNGQWAIGNGKQGKNETRNEETMGNGQWAMKKQRDNETMGNEKQGNKETTKQGNNGQ